MATYGGLFGNTQLSGGGGGNSGAFYINQSLNPHNFTNIGAQRTATGGGVGAGSPQGAAATNSSNINTQVANLDPWSQYRPKYGGVLDQFMGTTNPSTGLMSQLQQMLTPGGGGFQTSDPSYQFRLQQGNQAVERSAAARGLLGSGAATEELMNYAQGAASQEFGAQYNRVLSAIPVAEGQYQAQFSRLAQLAGVNIGPGVGVQAALGVGQQGLEQQRITNQANQYQQSFGLQQQEFGAQQTQYQNTLQQAMNKEAGMQQALNQQQQQGPNSLWGYWEPGGAGYQYSQDTYGNSGSNIYSSPVYQSYTSPTIEQAGSYSFGGSSGDSAGMGDLPSWEL